MYYFHYFNPLSIGQSSNKQKQSDEFDGLFAECITERVKSF